MVPHAMQLNALIIIDVQVLLLRYREHLVILQEAHIAYFLLGLEFTH